MTLSANEKMDMMAATGQFSFALETKTGKIKRASQGGKPQPVQPPEREINTSREISKEPNVAEGINTLVDYLVGSGFTIQPRNIPYTEAQLTQQDIAPVKELVETSNFESTLCDFVEQAIIDGMAFLEINWSEQEVFKPRLLPPKRIELQYDQYGEIIGYIMETEGDKRNVEYGKYDVAHLGFQKHPEEEWYQPLTQYVQDQAEMLRDMEIDMARFVATKAYPPILWKLGDEENEWSDAELNGWLDKVSQIEPDSMLVGPHDVEAESVTAMSGTDSALELGPTFEHLKKRISTGLGLPHFLLNGVSESRTDSVATMPKFDRRVKRLRTKIQETVEHQILRSLYYHPDPLENEGAIVPKLEFGKHSSEEERLEVSKALELFNNGFLTREALAQRVGIDPETELPTPEKLRSEIIPVINELSGAGDNIQNPEGGSPSETGGGGNVQSGTAKTRQNPERSVTDESREGRSVEDSDST